MDDLDVKDYTETVSVRLTKEQVARLRSRARREGMSQSDLIRSWVDTADLIPRLPPRVVERIKRIASGQRHLTPASVIENALRRVWSEWRWD